MNSRQKGKQSKKFQFIFKIEKECRELEISKFQIKILEKLRVYNGQI